LFLALDGGNDIFSTAAYVLRNILKLTLSEIIASAIQKLRLTFRSGNVPSLKGNI